MSAIRVRSGTAILLSAIVMWAGCGSETPSLPEAPVSGTVTFSGGDLPGGQVIFMHDDGQVRAAEFGADGKYTVNAVIGPNQVLVKSVKESAVETESESERGMRQEQSLIPEKYMMSGKSGLSFDVKEGENNTYDIALTADE